MPVSKFCWTRNRYGCDFFCDKSWGFLPVSEVSLIAQRSEVCTHCHDRGQMNTQEATPSGSSKLVGTRSPETTTNLSKDDPTLYVHFCSSPLCSLSFLVCGGEIDCWPSLSWYSTSRMVTSVAVPSEVADCRSGFHLNRLPDGQRLISAGGFPSEYISFGQGQNDKNETREGKQSRCLSKNSSLPDLSPYSGDRARQKLPQGQSNDLVPRYFERKSIARARNASHLGFLEALFIRRYTPELCAQKEFVRTVGLF